MARIVNDDSSESRQSVQYKSKTYQSYDYEIQDMTRYYDDTFNDHDELTIQSHFQNDEGGVPETVVDDLGELKKAAQVTLNARKPIIDWKTSNKSFIDVYNDLRRLGVKHCTFFLRLYDRDLVGVDPYSGNLPLEMQLKIYLECVINPWYFLREIARIPADGMPVEPGSGIQYILDRNNLASWYCFINHIDNYTSKPRQCGKTQDALLKLNYAYHFGASTATILFFNKDLALSKENLARLKDQRDLFPPYLQMKVAFSEDGSTIKGIDNITTMKNPVTGCQVKVMPCATSKEMGTRLGRGYTSSLMMFDEFDFTNYNTEIINASAFAFSRASENAINNHSCACRLFLSTPGDLSTRDGKAATDFIRGTKETKGMFIWDDSMYDISLDLIKKEIHSPKYNGIVFIEHDWKMLKKDVHWYEQQCNLCSYNQEVILREILLQRLNGSSMSPFTREQQLYLSSHKRPPKDKIDIVNEDTISTIYLYEKLKRRIPYIIAIDPAPGLGEDNNAMVIINPRTRKVAAEYKTPYISSKMMCDTVVNLMDQFCPQGLIVVEANRGHGLMERFMETHYAHRVWYDPDRLNALLTVKTDKYGGMPRSTMTRKVQGFVTGTKSRNLLFQLLENLVNESIDLIYTENLVNEILTLIRKPTGKIEAAQSEHDDTVMAYLIGMYVLMNASNLEEYGLRRWEIDMEDLRQEMRKETEAEYRDRVKAALPMLDEKYRGIFEDFVAARDPIRDSREFARKRDEAQKSGPQFMYRSTMRDDGMVGFDEEEGMVESTRVIDRHTAFHGEPKQSADQEDEPFLNDGFTAEDRAAFEDSIFGSNYDSTPTFNPSDWV